MLKNGSNVHDAKWTESITVGDREFALKLNYSSAWSGKRCKRMIYSSHLSD
jgi:hypothetical protein